MLLTDRLLLATVGFWWIGLLLLGVFRTGHRPNLLIGLSASLLLLGVRELLRRGQAVPAAALGVGLGWTVFTLYLYNLGTPFSVHLLGYMAVVIFAAWVGGARAGLAIALLSGITVYALARAATAGLLPSAAVMSPLALTLDLVAYLGVCTLLIALTRANFVRALRLAYDEVASRREAEAALRDLNATLEARVAARTAELSTSEARYRTLLALSPDGVFVTDNTGHLLACNEQAAQMHGYKHSRELLGRSVAELYVPESFANLFQRAAAVLQSGQDVARDIEALVRRRDGSVMEVECSIARVPWSDAPAAAAFLVTFRDIARRKQLAAELERHRLHLEELVQERTRALHAEIAERAAAQEALQRSEASLRAAGRLARLGSWERDLRTDRYFFSDEMYRIFGLEPQDSDTISDRFWSILHRDDRDAAYAIFKAVVETGAPQEATHRIILPSGEPRVVRALTQLTRHADGRPATVRGTVQDITEQEQTRVALAQRVEELSILGKLGHLVSFRHPLGEIIQIYLDRLLELADVDLAQMFLLREGRLHLAGISAKLPTRGAVQVPVLGVGECLCGTAAAAGQTVYARDIEGDLRCTRTDCHANGLHSLVALPLHDGEEVFGVLTLGASATDVFADRMGFLETIVDLIAGRLQNALLYQATQDHAAGLKETVVERTRELQAERDRTQAILETVGESVVVLDPDGCVLYANPATLQLTGAARDEVLGRPLWQCWSGQTSREIWLRAQQALAAGQSWHGETSGQRKDGTRYEAALTATPLYDDTNTAAPCGSVWVQQDITAIKEAERLKDRFVSNVSHELRTPISVIGLSCDNLATFGDRLSDSDRSQMLQDIHVQAHALSSLIEDILTLSQIDSGRGRQPWQEVDLARLVREQAERQRPIADGRSQEVSVSAAAPVPVQGSAIQLQQVVRNLLDNAIKYTPPGGKIRCTCEVRSGAGDSPVSPPDAAAPPLRAWAVIEITDTGIGVPADAIPLLFERFYRVHEEGEVPGTGLGLPIARELTVMHGGFITVASTPGEGSTFTVYLPLHDRQGAGTA